MSNTPLGGVRTSRYTRGGARSAKHRNQLQRNDIHGMVTLRSVAPPQESLRLLAAGGAIKVKRTAGRRFQRQGGPP